MLAWFASDLTGSKFRFCLKLFSDDYFHKGCIFPAKIFDHWNIEAITTGWEVQKCWVTRSALRDFRSVTRPAPLSIVPHLGAPCICAFTRSAHLSALCIYTFVCITVFNNLCTLSIFASNYLCTLCIQPLLHTMHLHCTMCILGSTMALWSNGYSRKNTFSWENNSFEAIFPMFC